MADIQRIESLLNDAVGHAMDYARGDNSASNKHEAAWNEALTLIRGLTRELLSAASGEPVAWKVVANDGRLIGYTGSKAWAGQHLINEATITPLYAHPSAAGVQVTEAMVKRAADEMYGIDVSDVSSGAELMYLRSARKVLTAALTAASEGASA